MKLHKTNMRTLVMAGALVALSMATASCGIYKKYETPQNTALTQAYMQARQDAAQDSTALGNILWEQVFTDPVLADLIQRALANNTDLADARINVEMAQAQLKGARMAYAPSLALAPSGQGASVAGSKLSWSYQLPAALNWEIDAFGKLLNSKRSAEVSAQQAEAVAQATRSQIIAAVASTYYSIGAVEAQLALSRRTALLWEASVNTMRDLKEAGRLTEAAVVQSDANYRSVLASIPELEASLVQLNNTMSLLLNVMPRQFTVSADATLETPAELNMGVPMAYLGMRPDVYAAERGLATAYYATASARAAFYPSLNITANGGFTNLFGSIIKNPGEWFYNLGASLTVPLFSRGQNITRLRVTKLAQQQAMNAFEKTVLSAAADVSNALTAYQKNGERITHLDIQVKDLEKSVDYTNDLLVYANGTYLEVITAQQSLLGAQMNLINCRLERSLAVINLYQAMGGGR